VAYYVIKILLTAVLVVLVSELGRKSAFWGGLLASLPLVSYLGLVWLYIDTQSVEKVSRLSTSVFWLVIPSLPFFILLPFLLKRNVSFPVSLGIATALMICVYFLMVFSLKKMEIHL